MPELTPEDRKAIAKQMAEDKEKSEMTAEEYDKRQYARDKQKSDDADKVIARLKEIEKLGYARNDIDKQEIDNAIEKVRLKEEELRLTTGVSAEQQRTFLLEVDSLEARKKGMDQMESALERYLGLTQDGGKMFDNLGDKAIGAAKKFSRMMNPANIAAAGITKVAETTVALALEQDAAAVAFNKATGQAGAYNDQIAGLERSMFNAGVTSANAGQAFQDLFTTVTDFSNMSESTRMDLAKTTALLSELGVSSSESAQSIQFLTKVMGQSTDQAAAQTREIFAFAQELGVSAAGMSADFIKMQPQIAALGDTGIQAFKDLQAQAKATGMSFDSLLSITAKFDTFAGAADQVGKLNAIMGGPFLNTLEMVAETDPAERMRKLSEGIGAAGLSFDSMSYYQKKAMTSAAGLNSEMELAMLMSGKLESARGPVKTQADFEKLADQTKEFTTVLDEMKQMGMSLAVSLAPVVGFIKGIVDGVTAWAPAMKGVIAAMVMYIGYQKISLALSSAQALMESIKTKGLAAAIGAAAFLAATAGVLATAYSAATTPSSSGKGYAVGTGGAPGGMALVGERGPEMVSLPKGSQVAANGSAGYNRYLGAYKDGTGASSTDINAAPGPQRPIIINLKIGNETIQQVVHDTDLSKTHYNGKKSRINETLSLAIAGKIVGD